MAEIRDPMRWALTIRRNARIDAWRRRRYQARLAIALPIYRAQLEEYYERLRLLDETRELAADLLGGYSRAGADEFSTYLLTGNSPVSTHPDRAAWDKRIQRARAWLMPQLTEEQQELLKRGRGTPPEKPKLRPIVLGIKNEHNRTAD